MQIITRTATLDLYLDLARSEPDLEIQTLIRASAGGRCDHPEALRERLLTTMVRVPRVPT